MLCPTQILRLLLGHAPSHPHSAHNGFLGLPCLPSLWAQMAVGPTFSGANFFSYLENLTVRYECANDKLITVYPPLPVLHSPLPLRTTTSFSPLPLPRGHRLLSPAPLSSPTYKTLMVGDKCANAKRIPVYPPLPRVTGWGQQLFIFLWFTQ